MNSTLASEALPSILGTWVKGLGRRCVHNLYTMGVKYRTAYIDIIFNLSTVQKSIILINFFTSIVITS